MKLKQQPSDFQVEELTTVQAGEVGPFSFYRLEKSGWSTHDALAAIRRRWQIDPRRLSYGGLKDRHAQTVQYFSIFHGPRRDLQHHQVRVTHLGQIRSPYSSKEIQANRFVIVLRDLSGDVLTEIDQRLAFAVRCGVPNYFDDQRFGSLSGPGGEWIAKLLIQGRFEDALKLALSQPRQHDRAEEKREKQLLRQHWGDWERLKAELPRGHARSLVDYLRVHPTNFKGTITRMRPELRSLYLSAYQSHLWNRCLASWLQQNLPRESLRTAHLRTGPVPFPLELSPELRESLSRLQLPLPSSRWKPEPDDPRLPLVETVLAEEGLTLREMQIRGLREAFFSRGERAAALRIHNADHDWADDELNRGKKRLILKFELPRGCYATMVVKAIISPDAVFEEDD